MSGPMLDAMYYLETGFRLWCSKVGPGWKVADSLS